MRSPRTPLKSLDDVVNRGHLLDPGHSVGRLTRSAARKRDPDATSPASTGSSTPVILERSNKKNPISGRKRVSVGRWEKFERMAFLKGLRQHGRGHWKLISTGIPTRYESRERKASFHMYLCCCLSHLRVPCHRRNTIQVKTHAQVVLKKHDEGFDIFQELDDHLQEQEAAQKVEENQNHTQLQNFENKKKRGRPRKVLSTDDLADLAESKSTMTDFDTVPVPYPMTSLSSPGGNASYSTTSTLNMTMASSFGGPRTTVDVHNTTSFRKYQHQAALRLPHGPHIATSMVPRAATAPGFSPRFFRFFPSSFEESRHRVAVLSSDLQQQPQSADAYAAAGALLGLAGSRSHL
jgi:hypothetical protein